MANTIEIVVEATDKTKGALGDIKGALGDIEGGFESLTGISLSTAGMFALAGTAVGAVVDYTKKAVEQTVLYVDQVKELARVGGLSFEEASGLIQIAEGMGISYKDLVTGLGNATKKGVDVSIENLLLLADEYNKLETPIDRAKWLTDNFGAAGANLAPMFEAGRAGVVTAMEGVNEALILDEADVQSVSDYEVALSDLKDSFDGLKTKVGLEVIPILLGLLDVLNNEDGARGTGFQRMFGTIETAADNATGAVKDLSAALGTFPGSVGGGGMGSAILGALGLTPKPKAFGGYVAGGGSYLVGELGPELFTPSGGGQITPNGQLKRKSKISYYEDGSTGGGFNKLPDFNTVNASVGKYSNTPLFNPEVRLDPSQVTDLRPAGDGGNDGIDYDRMADAFVQALERSSLVR